MYPLDRILAILHGDPCFPQPKSCQVSTSSVPNNLRSEDGSVSALHMKSRGVCCVSLLL